MAIIEALELRSMQSGEGIGLEFIFIICAVVGGCLLTGGFGSVIGTFSSFFDLSQGFGVMICGAALLAGQSGTVTLDLGPASCVRAPRTRLPASDQILSVVE
jgi:hypothetical protein